jgi:uncharacterized protein YodC (DUF2158 family)
MAKDLIQRTLEEEDRDRPITTGDLCHLKSGGPTMTVRQIEPDLVTVEWFDKAQLRSQRFKLSSLRRGPFERLPILNFSDWDAANPDREPQRNDLNDKSIKQDD